MSMTKKDFTADDLVRILQETAELSGRHLSEIYVSNVNVLTVYEETLTDKSIVYNVRLDLGPSHTTERKVTYVDGIGYVCDHNHALKCDICADNN